MYLKQTMFVVPTPLLRISIFCISSLSSQIGLIAARSHYAKHSTRQPLCEFIVILRINVEDFKLYPSLSLDRRSFRQLATTKRTLILDLNSTLVEFIPLRLVLLWCFWFLSSFADIELWQPRPGWIDAPARLRFYRFLLPFYPRLNSHFFGDGFLQKISHSTPFWFNSADSAFSRHYHNADSASKFYFLYELIPTNIGTDNRLVPQEVLACINALPESLWEHIRPISSAICSLLNDSSLPLLIFPTTSLSEGGRANLLNEISLYRDYLTDIRSQSDYMILLKPHPRSSTLKKELLARLSADMNSALFTAGNVISSGLFATLPLELVLHHLIYTDNINPSRLTVVIASTAGVSVKQLYPTVNYCFAFGDLLISKYICPEFQLGRINQERAMFSLV